MQRQPCRCVRPRETRTLPDDPIDPHRPSHGRNERISLDHLGWNVALEAGGWLVGEEVTIEIDVAVDQAA